MGTQASISSRGALVWLVGLACLLATAQAAVICKRQLDYPPCSNAIMSVPKGSPKDCCELRPSQGVVGTLSYQVQVPYLGAGKAGKVFLAQVKGLEGGLELSAELKDYQMVIKMPIPQPGGLSCVNSMRAAEMDQEAHMIVKLGIPLLQSEGFPIISGLGRFQMALADAAQGAPLTDFEMLELVGSDIGDAAISTKADPAGYSGPLAYFKSKAVDREASYTPSQEFKAIARQGRTMMCQLLKGLWYTTSRRVMLRDVKPDNVLARTLAQTFRDDLGLDRRVPNPMMVKWADFGKAIDLDNIRRTKFTGGWMADRFIAAPQRGNKALNIPETSGIFGSTHKLGANYHDDPTLSPFYTFDMWHAGYVLMSIAIGEDQKVTKRKLDPIATARRLVAPGAVHYNYGRNQFEGSGAELDFNDLAILQFGGWPLADLLSKVSVEEGNGVFRISPVEALYHPFMFNIQNNPTRCQLPEWRQSLAGQYADRLHELGLDLRYLYLGKRGLYTHTPGADGSNHYFKSLCTAPGERDIVTSCRSRVARMKSCRPNPFDRSVDEGEVTCVNDYACKNPAECRCTTCRVFGQWGGCLEGGQNPGVPCADHGECKSRQCDRGKCTACVRVETSSWDEMAQPLTDFCVDYTKLMCMSLFPRVSAERSSSTGGAESWFTMKIPRYRRDIFSTSPPIGCDALLQDA